MLTSNYQAEYGRAGGGFIALTTRGGTSEYHGGLRYFGRNEALNANTFFNNARGGAAAGFPEAAVPLQLLRVGSGRPRAARRHEGQSQDVFLRGAGVLRPARAADGVGEHPRADRARARRQLFAERRRHRQAHHDHRSADRPAVPGQCHPSRSHLCARARDPRLPAHAQHDRGRQRLQLHVAGVQRVPAPRGHRAHGLADVEEHAPERTLGPQLRRPAVRLRHDHRVVELSVDGDRAAQRAGHDALVHAVADLQPDDDE